ncbi:MAG: L-aspartate oxidase [Myxococcota bacterium]|nr:L-aspartate oxidase [Myxococcota bacterium]
MANQQADFLVIGSGLAGLNAAIELSEHGSVLLLSKVQLGESNTAYAQGGIASVMSDDDSFDAHVRDTLEAGAGLCHLDVVEQIIEAGPSAIRRLVETGVQFDASDQGFSLTREGGHSNRRILHAQDITGREIDRAFRLRLARTSNIRILQHHVAIDLVIEDRFTDAATCVGAHVLDAHTGKIETVAAKATLIATGGAGKAYLYTSNPDVSTGDGIGMAFRSGAKIANMEFFQFHPTCLFHPRAKSFLISEALRGEGGILRRRDGHAFMKDIHPLGDLAPRDIVARAIDTEMKRTGDDHVYLDMRHRDAAFVVERFPNIHTACLSFGIDMTQVPIPIVPAAHYLCGGIQTTVRGATTIKGLWAAGEAGHTGLHGANRLASNSLLEAAVVSQWAARDMASWGQERSAPSPKPWNSGDARPPHEAVIIAHTWDEIRRLMWNYVGIVRSKSRLEGAKRRIELIENEVIDYHWKTQVTRDLVELRNIVAVAKLVIGCALQREESRGLHSNQTHPKHADTLYDTSAQRISHNDVAWRRQRLDDQ